MRQYFSALAATVMAASVLLAGCGSNAQAQDNGGGQGPNSGMRAAMEKARDDAKTNVMNDLSAAHRAQIQAIVDGVNNGTDTDFGGDIQKIDAILSPDESKAVMGERDKMVAAMKAAAPPNAGANGPGGGRRGGGGMMRSNDPGRFVLMVNLSRERMRALREARQQHQGQ
ncbi:MAG TPA: hypothetical protein VMD91_00205 [Candidatus Sulfotelmatobacter sp.]|nr:hypothetical protein [Candidatus Sulfotelmatobacter sp.]